MIDLVRPFPGLGAREPSGFALLFEVGNALVPIPLLLLLIPAIWLFFRRTWREIDEESLRERQALVAGHKTDPRPMVALVMCAVILTMQEYYGGRAFFDQQIYPLVVKYVSPDAMPRFARYDELYGFAWWAATRIGGYVLPFLLWKAIFRQDSVLDLGLRTRGFFDHAWIYGLFLVIVVPVLLVVSARPDFVNYYPFYKNAPRSWTDFLLWESMYFAQFLALEMFFRGFWLGVLRRSFGSGAIFAMAVPYCMIHFGKPYLEAMGAIVAGIALGSLAMLTRSIYQGFLVHVTVAGLMDWMALRRRHCIPLTWSIPETPVTCAEQAAQRDAFALKIEIVVWSVVLSMAAIVAFVVVRRRRRRRAAEGGGAGAASG